MIRNFNKKQPVNLKIRIDLLVNEKKTKNYSLCHLSHLIMSFGIRIFLIVFFSINTL